MDAEAEEADDDAIAPPPDSASAVLLTPENRTLGRCRLRYLIAQGGMASVYLAQIGSAGSFERWVAVKVVHPHLGRDPRFSRMLLDEARITARIQHANVCSVLDFGKEGETCFLVMEYMHGESLASVLRRASRAGGLPWPVACRIVADAARGLHAAHELRDHDGRALGIVHRDISPQNLFVLYDGSCKVLDFGVASARNKLEKTATGEVKGKLAYMSPEQLLGQPTDRRTDVWALGVVLWESLTSTRLFRGEHDGQTVQRVLGADILRPSKTPLGARIPRSLEALVMRTLVRDSAQRLASAAELADALEDTLHAAAARASAREVETWMREAFADRRAMREAMLRQEMPAGIVPELELESAQTQVTPPLSTLSSPPAAARDTTGAPRARVIALAAFAFVVTLGIGVWLGAWGGGAASEAALEPDTTSPPLVPPPSAPLADARPVASGLPEASPPPEPPPPVPEEADAGAPRAERARGERAPSATGRLNLVAIPSARVYLRGRLLGETPLMNLELPAGRQTLELRSVDGAGVRRVSVTIRAGELTRESVR